MLCRCLIGLLLASLSALGAETSRAQPRPRARELGIAPGVFAPGPLNAITDVSGVRVGEFTLIEGQDIRTGVTAIVPHPGNLFQEKVPAAIVVGNGFGKLIGSTQVHELGQLETPILLTNTLNVWEGAAALVDYTLAQTGNEDVLSVNPVVGETNDGWLNNIRRRPLRREHFLEALRTARSGPVEEGAVGAGTGTGAFGYEGEIKAGIGTASRRTPEHTVLGSYIVGVLVQTNFAGILTIDGVPVGKELGTYDYRDVPKAYQTPAKPEGGSCMIVVATDAPLDAWQLRRLAWRAFAGMARTGATFQQGSGDYVIAFSTAKSMRMPYHLPSPKGRDALFGDKELSPLFQAVAEATEEAIYNSLLRATTVRGRDGHEAHALAIDEVQRILKKYGRGK
ncbi:MAG: P1 family peptidase [Acidobacteria bacterium]|nr:P1 family peptidase [Acidobacteriota bacterium]